MTENKLEVIDQFLLRWKEKAVEHYTNLKDEFLSISHAEYTDDSTIAERNQAINAAYKRKKEWMKGHSKATIDLLSYHGKYFEERLNTVLDRDVETKKKTLIKRIEKKAGEIIDADGLYVAENGEINGLIVGMIATVRVQTIYAGGYNIQMLHYRVLVKEI